MKNASRSNILLEKLFAHGPQSLGNAELLGVLIGDGVPLHSGVETAEKMLALCDGSLAALSQSSPARLRMHEGIGIGRAAVLAAAFELGKRAAQEHAPEPVVIRSAEDIIRIMEPRLARLPHEEMWVVYLSSAGGILEQRRVSLGGIAAVMADTRIIIKRALELLASSIILVHNHPSGIPTPSGEDVNLTERIAKAAAVFDILLIDHVIVSPSGHFCFRNAGLLDGIQPE